MSGAGSAEDALNQIKVVQGRDISLEEKNRLINNILSHSSRYVQNFKVFFMKICCEAQGKGGAIGRLRKVTQRLL